MLQFIGLMALAGLGSLLFGDPDVGVELAKPLAPLAIGAASGLVSKFIGGPKSSSGPDEESQRFIEMMRQFGAGGAQQLTGFDPATGEFTGEGAGPTAEQFGPESIDRFLNPFLAEREGQINEEFDRSRARDVRGVAQDFTKSGSGRGARSAVAEGLAMEGSDRNRALALNDIRLRGFQQASQTALGAQGFRNEALDANQLIRKLSAGQGLLSGGLGPTGQVGQGPGPDPFGTAVSAGTIASQFFGGGGDVPFGPGDPLRPGPINVGDPNVLPVPGTDLSPSGLISRG